MDDFTRTAGLASDDYEELAEILADRPDHAASIPTNYSTLAKTAGILPPLPRKGDRVAVYLSRKPPVIFKGTVVAVLDGNRAFVDLDDREPNVFPLGMVEVISDKTAAQQHTFGGQCKACGFMHYTNPQHRKNRVGAPWECAVCKNTYDTPQEARTCAEDDHRKRLKVESTWKDVQQKAKDIYDIGAVRILASDKSHVAADVLGDHGTYRSEIQFVPGTKSPAMWNCSCPWSAYSWGRSGRWKKYEGRVCSHTLALLYEFQHDPVEQVKADWDTDPITYYQAPPPKAWKVAKEETWFDGDLEDEAIRRVSGQLDGTTEDEVTYRTAILDDEVWFESDLPKVAAVERPQVVLAFDEDEARDSSGEWSTTTETETRPVITSDEARGNSRPVSHEEFASLAEEGKRKLDDILSDTRPTTAIDDHHEWMGIKSKAFDSTQKEWGGQTINPHTGEAINPDKGYSLTIKQPGEKQISAPIGDEQALHDAMDEAKETYADRLKGSQVYLGVFRDDDEKRVDVDPVVLVPTTHDVDTIGAHTHAIGGAYDFSTGNGYFPPHVKTQKAAAKLPKGRDIFWRLHNDSVPFDLLHAYSQPNYDGNRNLVDKEDWNKITDQNPELFGAPMDAPRLGFSAYQDPRDLWVYWSAPSVNGAQADKAHAHVIAFEGFATGHRGGDGELLVEPKRIVAKYTWQEFLDNLFDSFDKVMPPLERLDSGGAAGWLEVPKINHNYLLDDGDPRILSHAAQSDYVTLYHGTDKANVESIRANGIRPSDPGRSAWNIDHGHDDPVVYLTKKADDARGYGFGDEDAVVEVRVPKANVQKYPMQSGIMMHHGVIPPEQIVKVSQANPDLKLRVQKSLSDDLRREPWKGSPEPMAGHCYVASEAYYHLAGGKDSGLKPMFIKHEDAPHWFLRDKDGENIDLTASQFKTPVPYDEAKGKGFLTSRPSKRAQTVIDRTRKIATKDPKFELSQQYLKTGNPTYLDFYHLVNHYIDMHGHMPSDVQYEKLKKKIVGSLAEEMGNEFGFPKSWTVPADPGTTPIPPGHIRLWHYTGGDLDSVRKNGLQVAHAKGSTYGEPNMVWATAGKPDEDMFRNKNMVEFHLDPNQLDIGNPAGQDSEENTKFLEDRHSSVTVRGDVPPENIIAIHEPWQSSLRYLRENAEHYRGENQWMLDEDGFQDDPDTLKAIQQFKKEHPEIFKTSAKDVTPDQLNSILDGLAHNVPSDGVFNLCDLDVGGTNLFCQKSLPISRDDMPQLQGQPTKGSLADALPKDSRGNANIGPLLADYLDEIGYHVTYETADASTLLASQNQLNGAKVAQLRQAYENGRLDEVPLVISSDNYIVDGHHRWAGMVAAEFDEHQTIMIPVARVAETIIPLLAEAKAFAGAIGVPQADVSNVHITSAVRPKCEVCGRRIQFSEPRSAWTHLKFEYDMQHHAIKAGTKEHWEHLKRAQSAYISNGEHSGDLDQPITLWRSVTDQEAVDRTKTVNINDEMANTWIYDYGPGLYASRDRDRAATYNSGFLMKGHTAPDSRWIVANDEIYNVAQAEAAGYDGLISDTYDDFIWRKPTAVVWDSVEKHATLHEEPEPALPSTDGAEGEEDDDLWKSGALLFTAGGQGRDVSSEPRTDRANSHTGQLASTKSFENAGRSVTADFDPHEPRDSSGEWTTSPGSQRIEPLEGDTVGKGHLALDLRMHSVPKEVRQRVWDRMSHDVGSEPEVALHNVVQAFERTPNDLRDEFLQWYPKTHDLSRHLGRSNHVNVHVAAAIIAASSAGASWYSKTGNKDVAETIIEEASPKVRKAAISPELREWINQRMTAPRYRKVKGKKVELPPLTKYQIPEGASLEDVFHHIKDKTPDTQHKILGMLVGKKHGFPVGYGYGNYGKSMYLALKNDPKEIDTTLTGPKIRSFFNNIEDPDNHKDVTIDVHMWRSFLNDGGADRDATFKKYENIEENQSAITGNPSFSGIGVGAYPIAADVLHMATGVINSKYGTNYSPSQVQAVVWGNQKAEWPLSEWRRRRDDHPKAASLATFSDDGPMRIPVYHGFEPTPEDEEYFDVPDTEVTSMRTMYEVVASEVDVDEEGRDDFSNMIHDEELEAGGMSATASEVPTTGPSWLNPAGVAGAMGISSTASYYHGTEQDFVPGQIVDPKTGPQHDSHFFLAPDVDTASFYGGANGKVYEVEPTGRLDSDPNEEGFKTSAPVRIVREVPKANLDEPGYPGSSVTGQLTGPAWLNPAGGESGASQGDSADIAGAAREFLAHKTFTRAEQEELINEGDGHAAAKNLANLDLTGTHYQQLEEALAGADSIGDQVIWWS